MLATGKHMVGHGLAEGGLNQAPVHVGARELRDEQLFPFEAAVRSAGLGAIMPAYCDVDGLPCHGSHELLTDILRDEWGFDGIVVSDYTAIQMLVTQHRLSADLGTVAAMALRAGVDSELPSTVGYGEVLLRAVADGRLDEATVDLAVERILRMKFRLGLFERPTIALPSAATLGRTGGRRAAGRPRPGSRVARPRRERRHLAAAAATSDASRSSARSPTARAT